MTDLKQEARTLTLGERMILAARLAVWEHLRQSVSSVPQVDDCCWWGDHGGTESRPEQPSVENASWQSSLHEDSLATLVFPTRDLVGLP